MPTSVPQTPAEASPTRPAATVLLLREQDGTVEVLMLRRHARSGFAASAWVFPGGVVDRVDETLSDDRWDGIDPAGLARRFALSAQATLGMHAAAVRETFEEAGVLLARHRDGRPPEIPADALAAMRRDLNDREREADWAGFLTEHDLVLDLAAMTYWLRWVTPIQEPKRYDTCFFLARLPADADPRPDEIETTEAQWIQPREALEDDDFAVIFPTRVTLEWMAEHASVPALLDHARNLDVVPPVQPHIVTDAEGRYTNILLPTHEDFPHHLYG